MQTTLEIKNPFFRFNPILKTVTWGGTRIAEYKGISTDATDVGESWEISGVTGKESVVCDGPDKGLSLSQLVARYGSQLVGKHVYAQFGNAFPLLIKFIDAHDNLSLQVHPGDTIARQRHSCAGKTEMWYIIESHPDAQLSIGFNRDFTEEEYEQRVADGSIMDLVARHNSQPGAVYYVPAGRIHSIGSGNLLLEVQQTSEISYRVYDYKRRDANGNERELHPDLAKEALDFKASNDLAIEPHKISDTETQLVKCNHFDVHKFEVSGEVEIDFSYADSFVVAVCTDGSATLSAADGNSITLHQGDTILIAACAQGIKISGNGTIITATA